MWQKWWIFFKEMPASGTIYIRTPLWVWFTCTRLSTQATVQHQWLYAVIKCLRNWTWPLMRTGTQGTHSTAGPSWLSSSSMHSTLNVASKLAGSHLAPTLPGFQLSLQCVAWAWKCSDEETPYIQSSQEWGWQLLRSAFKLGSAKE